MSLLRNSRKPVQKRDQEAHQKSLAHTQELGHLLDRALLDEVELHERQVRGRKGFLDLPIERRPVSLRVGQLFG
jgi:hypothetical protein